MSSSQNNIQTKKMTSIRRKLTMRVIHKKLSVSFWLLILTAFLMLFTWILSTEHALTGSYGFDKNYVNEISYDAGEGNVFDRIANSFKSLKVSYINKKTGIVLYQENMYLHSSILFGSALALHVLMATGSLVFSALEGRRIRRIMGPIYELALKVDELSKLELSEDKYQLIENAIENIEPDEQNMLSLGDSELMGIERAMNSLLVRIRESNKQQARFVNDASHELRTPIAVIEGYANMLDRWGKQDEKVLDESITAIKNESANMKHLVEQLLFLARGDAGRTVINKERISLQQIMQEVYEESLMIDENHIYKMSCPVDDIYVTADEGLLKQAVRILVDNAAKYTKEKDEIILSVGYGENMTAYLQVQDTGIGMNESNVQHMFERFYRADEARSFDGTGLGLSIAKWIVDKHQGHFEIVSREELGTRIGIYLPIEL